MHFLPSDAFSCRIAYGRLLPRWLDERDGEFVSSVLETIASFDGLTVGEATLAAERFFPNRIAEGIWQVERRRWSTTVDAPLPPEMIRRVVFECAAQGPRADALAGAAGRLGVPVGVLEASLFADRASRRRLCAADTPGVDEVTARFNLAVVQTLLARAMDVEARLAGDMRQILRAAKGDGLLVQVSAAQGDDEQARISLAGPLALFHDTAKYGRALAKFIPSLVAAPGWSLRASVVMAGQRAELVLRETDGVAFAGSLAGPAVDPISRRLARDLQKGGVRVNLAPPVLRMGERLVLPDFALEWGEGRVLVDIIPFATAEHLAAQLALAERLGAPMLLCVQARSSGSCSSPLVVPYERAIDAWRLLDAARNLLRSAA